MFKIKTKLLNANNEFKKENHFAFKYIGQSRELLISFVISGLYNSHNTDKYFQMKALGSKEKIDHVLNFVFPTYNVI